VGHWGGVVRSVRLRSGYSQQQLAEVLNISQRTVSRWERGDDNPSIPQQRRLRDLGWEPPGSVLRSLLSAVQMCPVPRALSYTPRLILLAASKPALEKRPILAERIGQELIGEASGILQEMLDDRQLQRSIARREIAGVVATTQSVLKMPGPPVKAAYQTTITYFWHEGSLFSDAISLPVAEDADCGYSPVPMDSIDSAALPFMDMLPGIGGNGGGAWAEGAAAGR
jgi:transcriptional regulator with XRE-family HTH domain